MGAVWRDMLGLSNDGWDNYVIHLDQSEPSDGLHKCSKPWLESQNMSCQTTPQLLAEALVIPWPDYLLSPRITSKLNLNLNRSPQVQRPIPVVQLEISRR